MRSVRYLPVLLVGFLFIACGSDKKGPPPEATAVPAGTAISATATAAPPSPTPALATGFRMAGTAKLANVTGLVFQRGDAGLLAYSRTAVQLIDAAGTQKSVLTVADPESIAAASDTGFVAVRTSQTSLRVQNVRVPGPPKTIAPGLAFSGVTLSADGSLLALSEVDKIAALLWDVEENSKLKELTGFQTAAPVYSLRFGPDGRSLIWISRAHIQLMDIATGTLSKPFEHEDFVGGLALSADGKTLITGAGPKINIWDVASGQARSGLEEKGPVTDMALSSDNRLLAVATPQGCRLWDITTGKETGFMPGVARLVAFSDDGHQLAVADDQGNIVLWRSGG